MQLPCTKVIGVKLVKHPVWYLTETIEDGIFWINLVNFKTLLREL